MFSEGTAGTNKGEPRSSVGTMDWLVSWPIEFGACWTVAAGRLLELAKSEVFCELVLCTFCAAGAYTLSWVVVGCGAADEVATCGAGALVAALCLCSGITVQPSGKVMPCGRCSWPLPMTWPDAPCNTS